MSVLNNTASFQKTVNRKLAPGQPGNHASQAPRVVSAYLAMTDVVPGTFVVNRDTMTGTPLATTANSPKKAGYSTTATGGIIAGLVTRDATGFIPDVRDSWLNIVNAGLNVQVASKGEYMITLAEVTAGTAMLGDQIAVLDRRTGVPTIALSATADTDRLDWWLCEILDAATGLCVISSWRKA